MSLSNADQQARSRFQSALLAWLRGPDDASGLREMIAVVRGQAIDDAANALLWRSAEAFLQALLDGTLGADDDARQLCRRLERQLGRGGPSKAGADPSELRDALFAYVSNRAAAGTPPVDDAAPANAGGLSASLAGTVDVLPLMALDTQTPRRFSDEQHARWTQAAAALDTAWHAAGKAGAGRLREAATALAAAALALNDAPALALAEALADAAGVAEESSSVMERPAFRAAFAAALEIACEADGPEQKAFDSKVEQAVRRLHQNRQPVERRVLPGGPKPWFAEDAREWLQEMHGALAAVPPKRMALLAGVEWLAQQDACNMIAIRGLATLAHQVLLRVRAEDLDVASTHTLMLRLLESLERAIGELAAGQPPVADESVFAELRALNGQLKERRTNGS